MLQWKLFQYEIYFYSYALCEMRKGEDKVVSAGPVMFTD